MVLGVLKPHAVSLFGTTGALFLVTGQHQFWLREKSIGKVACWLFRQPSGVIDLVRPTADETEASQGMLLG